MKVTPERATRNSEFVPQVHISFDGYGFRLLKPQAEKLLAVLKSYFDQSIRMQGITKPDKLVRFFTGDPDIQIVEERPANAQGVFTDGTLQIQVNERTAYFTVSNNDAKALMIRLETILADKPELPA